MGKKLTRPHNIIHWISKNLFGTIQYFIRIYGPRCSQENDCIGSFPLFDQTRLERQPIGLVTCNKVSIRRRKMACTREGVKKGEPTLNIGEKTINKLRQKQDGGFYKVIIKLPSNPAITLLHRTKVNEHSQRDICIPTVIGPLLTVAKKWKHAEELWGGLCNEGIKRI